MFHQERPLDTDDHSSPEKAVQIGPGPIIFSSLAYIIARPSRESPFICIGSIQDRATWVKRDESSLIQCWIVISD